MLSQNLSGGPHNLGDPNDRTLRKVEKDILIPSKIRDKTKKEKCTAEVADFEKCGKSNGFSMFYKCRKENNVLKECLTNWYQNEEFIELCTEEYLDERSKYRSTGISQSRRKKESAIF